ncbi:MAG: S-layer homology domain-containing protein [Clostridia bacterium]|nr:S-layer homology domain-containing protein [Clostridia bacterium]
MKKILLSAVSAFSILVSAVAFAEINYSYDENHVSFDIEKSENGDVNYTDKISFAVLKPGKEFEYAKASDYKYIDAYNQSENNVNIDYFFSDNDWGAHKLRLTVTHKDNTSFFREYSFYYNSPEDINALITDMKNVKAEGVNACLKKYAFERKVLNLEEISEINPENINLDAKFRTAYEMTRDIFASGGEYEFKTAVDVLNSLKLSMLADALMNKDSDSFCSLYEKYIGSASGLIDNNVSSEKYFEIFECFKNSIGSYTDLMQSLKKTSLLTLIDNGTSQNLIDAVTRYGSSYGIDIEETKEKGVAPGDIAARIDKSNAVQYADSFGTVYKNIESSLIPKGGNTVPGSVSNKGGGGSGSRGGGNYSVPTVTENAVQPEQAIFTDVSDQMWAHDYIKYLKQQGSINGYGDGSFRPDSYVMREEFIKLVIESLKIKTDDSRDLLFLDCDKNQWYYPYIKIAYSNRIVKGKDDYTIGIGEEITREDMAVIICRAAGIKSSGSDLSFTDIEDFSEYAVPAVSAAAEIGVITGYGDGSFKPKNKATRAETAAMICRVLNYLSGETKS